MKTIPCRRSSQSDDSIGTQMQLKDVTSVDLVNAQMAEAWQVQQKRWKPQLRQEGTRDGQSSEVLRNQNMLHIMSENEKCLSYSLGVNQFTDSTQEECESTYLGYKHQNVSKLITPLGRFHYDGGILDLPCDWDWSESSVEVMTPVKNQGQCGSCWAFSMTDALEGVFAVGNGWTQTMFEQQILDCNTWGSGCQGGPQRQLSLQCSCDVTSVKDGGAMLSRRS